MAARLNRVVEIAFDERVFADEQTSISNIVDSFDKRFSRRVVEDHARFSPPRRSSRDARASRTNPESIKSRVPSFLVAKFFAWGIARARRQGREREEAVLKSEKLNYIAVKNDARGFSVS